MNRQEDTRLAFKLIYMSTADLLKLADRYADKCGKLKVKV